MDTVTIGEYLKRLRLRDNYTQSELGKRINVTDKAISRWESGLGMPEIGNLMVIAELFNVSVDDILHCNLRVFENDGQKPNDGLVENDGTTENLEDKKPVSNLFNKFKTIIFSAFLSMGIFLATYVPVFDGTNVLTLNMLPFILLIIASGLFAAVIVAEKFLPSKFLIITKIINVALSAVCALACLVFAILLFSVYSGAAKYYYNFNVGGFGALTFTVLLVELLLYSLSDLLQKDLFKKVALIVSAALGGVALALGLIGLLNCHTSFIDSLLGSPDSYVSLCAMLMGLISVAYALRGLKVVGMGVAGTVLMFLPAVLFAIDGISNFTIIETPIETDLYPYELLCAFAVFAPAVTSIGGLFEGAKALKVRRITAVISLLLLIPCIYYTFDVLALDVYLGSQNYIVAVLLRVAVIFAAIASYVTLFIPSRKGEEK